jgi:hypothetical protein
MSRRRAAPKPANAPSGGSELCERGGTLAHRRRAAPKPANAPSGGSAGAQRRSVGAA